MKKRKLKLIKRVITASIVGVITSTLLLTPKAEATPITYKEAEMAEVEEFIGELNIYQTATDIIFHNQELYNIISSKVEGDLTSSNIKDIHSLEISSKLNNEDISDLKYLTNLKYLKISNNNIDLSNIEFNQELCGITFDNCTLQNIDSLPNSVEVIYLNQCNVTDSTLITPYNLKYISFRYSPISNIKFKNPSSIQKIEITGNTYFSVMDLVDCLNLYELDLSYCSDIKNSEYLTEIKSLEYIYLTEYAAIWLDDYTLQKLPTSNRNKETISTYIKEIDEIATKLADKSLSTEEKVNIISVYLLNKYDYDERTRNTEISEELSYEYNIHPIQTSLNEENIICINYASMFQALANRLDIEAITVLNNTHAWNAIKQNGEYKGVDITFLEATENSSEYIIEGNGQSLDSYIFDINDVHAQRTGAVYPKEYEETSDKTGYIKPQEKINVQDILYNGIMYRLDNDLLSIKQLLLGLLTALSFINLISPSHDTNKTKRKVLEK